MPPGYTETQNNEAEIYLEASRREFPTQTGYDIYLHAERLPVLYSDSYLLVTVPAAHTDLKNKHSSLIRNNSLLSLYPKYIFIYNI